LLNRGAAAVAAAAAADRLALVTRCLMAVC
jgi:hypothetical protein